MENNLLLFREQIGIASAALGVGILRDVLLNKLPWLLKTGLYGTIRACLFFIKFMRFYRRFCRDNAILRRRNFSANSLL